MGLGVLAALFAGLIFAIRADDEGLSWVFGLALMAALPAMLFLAIGSAICSRLWQNANGAVGAGPRQPPATQGHADRYRRSSASSLPPSNGHGFAVTSFFPATTDERSGLFEVCIEVDAAGHADPRYSQATTTSALWADSEAEARQLAVADLIHLGYQVRTGGERISRLDPAAWDDYLCRHWPAQVGRAPDQAEVSSDIAAERFGLVRLGFYPHE